MLLLFFLCINWIKLKWLANIFLLRFGSINVLYCGNINNLCLSKDVRFYFSKLSTLLNIKSSPLSQYIIKVPRHPSWCPYNNENNVCYCLSRWVRLALLVQFWYYKRMNEIIHVWWLVIFQIITHFAHIKILSVFTIVYRNKSQNNLKTN